MHKMSKESATTLASLQKRLNNAEGILKQILSDDITRDFLCKLTTGYFSYIRKRENNNE